MAQIKETLQLLLTPVELMNFIHYILLMAISSEQCTLIIISGHADVITNTLGTIYQSSL